MWLFMQRVFPSVRLTDSPQYLHVAVDEAEAAKWPQMSDLRLRTLREVPPRSSLLRAPDFVVGHSLRRLALELEKLGKWIEASVLFL